MNENHLQASLQENFMVRRSSPSCYAIDVIGRCGKVLVDTSSTDEYTRHPILLAAYCVTFRNSAAIECATPENT